MQRRFHKRSQMIIMGDFSGKVGSTENKRQHDKLRNMGLKKGIEEGKGYTAVSYTHLDVYKRQQTQLRGMINLSKHEIWLFRLQFRLKAQLLLQTI